MDLQRPIAWFDTATALLLDAGAPAQASAAASEAGRALFGCQRPLEGLARFEHAVAHARAAFDSGTELACRLSSAAVSFIRHPDLASWERAADMLAQAVAACAGDRRDDQLLRVVCACNLASVRFVLERAGRAHGQPRAARESLASAVRSWTALGLHAPGLEVRLLLLQAVLAGSDQENGQENGQGQGQEDAAGLRARATALWQAQLHDHEGLTEDMLWQLGEAAFYLRLHLATLADPALGASPVIAHGFALSDLSREIRVENGNLVPIGFLFPVAPFMDIFDDGYIDAAIQIVEDHYGQENRILDELHAIRQARLPAASR